MRSLREFRSFLSYWQVFSNFFMMFVCYLSTLSFSSNRACNLATTSFKDSKLLEWSPNLTFNSLSSLDRYAFSACSSSFFFFS